jgi:DNA topoisomerase-6 subunit B
LKGGKLPTEKLKAQLQKIASSRTGGIKTEETFGKTGAGPEGLPRSIIVTAEGIEGDVTPPLNVSRAGDPATEGPDRICIEEKLSSSKPGRRQTAKPRSDMKASSNVADFPSLPKKGSSAQQQAGTVRTGRKAYQVRKKK